MTTTIPAAYELCAQYGEKARIEADAFEELSELAIPMPPPDNSAGPAWALLSVAKRVEQMAWILAGVECSRGDGSDGSAQAFQTEILPQLGGALP